MFVDGKDFEANFPDAIRELSRLYDENKNKKRGQGQTSAGQCGQGYA